MKDIIIVGFGGHARSVADCIERTGQYNIVGYTDLYEATPNNGYKYLIVYILTVLNNHL